MNNQVPFFNPFVGFKNISDNQSDYERLINKIERLEKDIRILENRINKLEKQQVKSSYQDEPTDMYMI